LHFSAVAKAIKPKFSPSKRALFLIYFLKLTNLQHRSTMWLLLRNFFPRFPGGGFPNKRSRNENSVYAEFSYKKPTPERTTVAQCLARKNMFLCNLVPRDFPGNEVGFYDKGI